MAAAAAQVPVKKAPKAKKPAVMPVHPSYGTMIAAAVKDLKDRKGSSRQAILKYILANYRIGDDKKSSAHLRIALKKGVASGVLKQVTGAGASGLFKIAKEEKHAKKAVKKPTAKNNTKKPAAKKVPKAKKPAVKPAHPLYGTMITFAVKNLNNRKGSSRQAILKFIIASYKVGDKKKASVRLRIALKKGVASGALKQVKGAGASGSFKIAKEEKPAKNAAKVKKPASKPDHPPYGTMIAAAVKTLNNRKGSSRQAILKFILATYKIRNEKKSNDQIRMALRRGVSAGALKQVKGTGASGSFKIAKEEKPTKNAAKKPAANKATKNPTTNKAAKKLAANKAAKKLAANKAAKKLAANKAAKKLAAKKLAANKAAKKLAANKAAKKPAANKAAKKPAAKKPVAKKPAAKK